MPAIITDAGLALIASHVGAGTTFAVDTVKLGTAQYNPTADQTDIRTPFSPVRELTARGVAASNVVQFTAQDDGDAAYNVGEIGWFSGATLVAVWAEAGQNVLVKGANSTLIATASIPVTAAQGAAITFSGVSTFPLATVDSAGIVQLHGTIDNTEDAAATPRAVSLALAELEIAASQVTSGEFSALRIPGLAASKIVTGILNAARIPNLSATKITHDEFSPSRIPSLNASKITEGVFDSARLPTVGLPTGMIVDFGGATVPSGYLLCDGAAVSRTTYADLFAVLGATWGAGDGSTTFNLPDLRGRATIGVDGAANRQAANLSDLGEAGGAATHTLSVNEMPSHSHGVYASAEFGAGLGARTNNRSTATFPTTSAGGGRPHNNMPPSAVVNKIIKT